MREFRFYSCSQKFHREIWGRGIFLQHQRAICESFLHKGFPLYSESKKVYYVYETSSPFSPLLSPPTLLSAVFTSNKLLVVVSEMYGDEREALDIVPVITTALLEEHQLVTGIIVVVDPGTIPINSRGEKQRVHLRDSFLADEVDPIYVAYNL